MESCEQLTSELWYERRETASLVSAGSAPIVQLRRGASRAHVDLVLLRGDRTIEVSVQPATPVDLVREHAQRLGRDPNGWTGALASAVARDAGQWRLWAGRGSGGGSGGGSAPDLLCLFGAMTHPVLGAAYDAGAAPVREVPRWASAAFAQSLPKRCAVSLFDARVSTRSVVRSLAHFLGRPTLAWWQLAIAVAAAPVVEPDDIAQALVVELDESEVTGLPSAADVRVVRAGLALLGRDRAWPLVQDSLDQPGCGARRLVIVLELLLDVQRDVRWPPPPRLDDLEAVCLRAAPIDPARAPVSRTPVPVDGAPSRPRAAGSRRSGWTVPRNAPQVAGPQPSRGTQLPMGAVARSLSHVTLEDGIELVAPRTPAELTTWGQLLGNCLADFAPAVATGTTEVLGVRERGVLVAALEVRNGRIVQLLGPHNRPPPTPLSTIVVRQVEAELSA